MAKRKLTEFQKAQIREKYKSNPDKTTKVSRVKPEEVDDVYSAQQAEVEKENLYEKKKKFGHTEKA